MGRNSLNRDNYVAIYIRAAPPFACTVQYLAEYLVKVKMINWVPQGNCMKIRH